MMQDRSEPSLDPNKKTMTQQEWDRANTSILANIAQTMISEYLERKKNSTPITPEEIKELGNQITAEQAKHKLV